MNTQILKLPVDGLHLKGELTLPEHAQSLIIFSHGSGSCRMSVKNKQLAAHLQEAGFGTLLFDLLSAREDEEEYRFDIELLARRLSAAAKWIRSHDEYGSLSLAYFGASLGTAAALKSAAQLGPAVTAIVSRGGRPDLTREDLPDVMCPVLLITGEYDWQTLKLNEQALRYLKSPKELFVVPAASHFFEEPGKLDIVARISSNWFKKYMAEDKKDLQLLH